MKRLGRVSLCLLTLGTSGCYRAQRLQEVGAQPALTPTQDPRASYHKVTTPLPREVPYAPASHSLWRTGARTFFKDQRANREGDILTVLVDTDDRADLQNSTRFGQNSQFQSAIPNLLGLEQSALGKVLPKEFDPKSAVKFSRKPLHDSGSGTIRRKEKIHFRMAAMVMEVLPNGTLSIKGRQEIRVNGELRALELTGFVRPEDILADNSVAADRISEARIVYGGRGSMSDHQDPPALYQIMQNAWPF